MKRIAFTLFCILWLAALVWLAAPADLNALRDRLEAMGGEMKGAQGSKDHESAFDVLNDPERGQLRGVSKGEAALEGFDEDLSGLAMPDGASADARRLVDFLASQKSRVPGHPGHEATAEFLIEEFRTIFEPENIHIEEFEVTAPVNLYTRVHIPSTNETFSDSVNPLWPFSVKLHTFAGGKAEGQAVYCGKGAAEEFDGKPIEGAIALLDYDCGANLMLARSLGAKATILLERGAITYHNNQGKLSIVPTDAPVFFAEGDAVEALLRAAEASQTLVIETRSEWRNIPVKNIWAEFPGEDSLIEGAELYQQTRPKWDDNILLLNAYYDSMSVVPARAPGATGSAGLVTLVETARQIGQWRKAGIKNRHRLLFLVNGAHHFTYQGVTDFIYRHSRGEDSHFRQFIAPEDLIDPQLAVSFEMTDNDPRVLCALLGTGATGGFDYRQGHHREFRRGSMQKIAGAFMEYANRAYGGDLAERVMDGVKPRDRNENSFYPAFDDATPEFDSDIFSFAGRMSMGLTTPDDPREFDDTPADTFDKFNIENVEKQIATMGPVVMAASRDPLFFERPVYPRALLKDYGSDISGRAVWYDVKSSFSAPTGRMGEGGLAVAQKWEQERGDYLGIRKLNIQKTRFNEPQGGDENRGYSVKLTGELGWRAHVSRTSLRGIQDVTDEEMARLNILVAYEDAGGAVRTEALTGKGTEYFAELPGDAKRIVSVRLEESAVQKQLFGATDLLDAKYDAGNFRLSVGALRYASLKVWSRDFSQDDAVTAVMSYRGPQEIDAPLAFDPEATAAEGRPVFQGRVDSGTLGIEEIHWTQRGKEKSSVLFANITFEDVFLFRMPPQGSNQVTSQVRIDAYRVNSDGEIDFATDEGNNGTKSYPNEIRKLRRRTEEVMVVTFPCRAVTVFDTLDSRYLSALDKMTVLSAGDSEPIHSGKAVRMRRSRAEGYSTLEAVAFVEPDQPLKLLMSSNFFGLKYLLVNAPDEKIDRKFIKDGLPADIENLHLPGYPPERNVIFHTAYNVARDIWLLDESRARKLARFGVKNQRLDFLHKQAYGNLVEAKEARERLDYSAYLAKTYEAWGLESRAYPDVKKTAVDTVKGIIFYFALLLPFSFFMERLLFGFADFRKQIAGVCFLFVLAFFVLRWVHPAFKISDSPYVIFLAFLILSLGMLVIITVVMKFSAEIKKMKAEASGIVEADVGRLSATYSAIILGISNLRKRKVRTALTASTIILLTFCVLSFTSITQSLDFWRIPIQDKNNCAYKGAMLRNRNYQRLQAQTPSMIQEAFKGRAKIVQRNWKIFPVMNNAGLGDKLPAFEIINPATGKNAIATGFTGLQHEEIEVPIGFKSKEGEYYTGRIDEILLDGSRWLRPGDETARVIILPDFLADRMGVEMAAVAAGNAQVRMFGNDFNVIGVFDSAKANRMYFLDNESWTPIDTKEASTEISKEINDVDPTDIGGSAISSMPHLDARNVPILPFKYLSSLSSPTAMIAIYDFADEEAFLDEIKEYMSRVSMALFVGDGETVQVYSSVGGADFSGLAKLFIPILIVAAMVLNTMMGAVYERFREIGIYSSVGLAPNHIGALFLAESFVFATTGAVIGYLVSQVLAFGLSKYGLLSGINLNYSSMAAIFATVIVMATVLVSTIYPARKAANMAVPDVSRSWSLEPPKSDEWNFVFPFTVGGADVAGLNVFLRDYFLAYEENSVGDFFTRGVNLAQAKKGPDGEFEYCLNMNVWLSPYDMSISQEMTMRSVPTGQHNVYEVHVTLRRLSGEVRSWIKMNHEFLNILRKRFLVWRTVPQGMKNQYAAKLNEGAAV